MELLDAGRAGVIGEIFMNDFRVGVVPGDEAKWRIRIFIDRRMEPRVDPLRQAREIGPPGEVFSPLGADTRPGGAGQDGGTR